MSQMRSTVGRITDFTEAEEPSGVDMLNEVESEPESIAPAATFAAFTLDEEEPYLVDRSDARYPVWSVTLRRWPRYGLPVYVEAEDDSRLVGKLVTPDVKRVASIESEPREGRLKVVPHATPIFYYLSTQHERFGELRDLLLVAARTSEPLLFFIDPESPLNDDRILDVRRAEGEVPVDDPLPGGEEDEEDSAGSLDLPAAESFDATAADVLDLAPPAPPALRLSVSEGEARFLFDDLHTNHQIPFCYIRDCCKARAHKMCSIIRAGGVEVRKVWNYGSGTLATTDEALWTDTLSVETPQGTLNWKFHTAPLIQVRLTDGEVVARVLDPSTLDGPATIEEWRGLQSDPGSRVRVRDARFYWFSPHDEPGSLDENLEVTESRLIAHANKCV